MESEASRADHDDLKEFQEFRKDVVKETNDQYVSMAEKIANKIADVESILDARGLRRRKNAGHHHSHSERANTKKAMHNEPPKIENKSESADADSFPYAYLFKYGLTLMGGMIIMLIYQRLSALDKIIKFIEADKEF